MFELTPNFDFGQLYTWIGHQMARYDFQEARRVILSNIRTDSNLT